MVSATRWRQDHHLAPNNPNQKLRWYPTFPSNGGGYSTFGWSPQASFDGQFTPVGSAAGFMTKPGLSGAVGAPLIPGWSGIAKVAGAILGVAAGAWLAKRNIEG
jgi:hypothetical protein